MICSSVNRLLRMASPWISCPGTLTSAGSGLGDKLSDSVARLRLSSPVRHSNASSQRVTTMRATPRWQGALARSVGVLVGAVSRKGATRCAGLAGGAPTVDVLRGHACGSTAWHGIRRSWRRESRPRGEDMRSKWPRVGENQDLGMSARSVGLGGKFANQLEAAVAQPWKAEAMKKLGFKQMVPFRK